MGIISAEIVESALLRTNADATRAMMDPNRDAKYVGKRILWWRRVYRIGQL